MGIMAIEAWALVVHSKPENIRYYNINYPT